MIRYFDTGQNGAADSLGRWLDRELVAGIRSFRGQFGYFDGSALRPFLPVLQGMVAGGGMLRLVIGANSGDPAVTTDLAELLSLLEPADRTSLTVVALSGALFHPKTMHLEYDDTRRFGVVSSANLTRNGLGRNVEAGIILEAAAGTDATIQQIASAIDRWANSTEPGVFQVRVAADIDSLRALGLAVTPAARREIRRRQRTGTTAAGRGTRPVAWRPPNAPVDSPDEDAEEIEGAIEPLPAPPAGGPIDTQEEVRVAIEPLPAGPAVGRPPLTLLWQSKPLTRRDLTIPNAAGTNQTGSINLDKGLLAEDVDHRHFFRDQVFEHLAWEHRSRTVDEAFAHFALVIDGVHLGEFDLPIRHSTSTTSETYLQRNAMTRLSWGPMRPHVARDELIGRTLSLYRRTDDPTQFELRIEL